MTEELQRSVEYIQLIAIVNSVQQAKINGE
jgi:hypothetical protein